MYTKMCMNYFLIELIKLVLESVLKPPKSSVLEIQKVTESNPYVTFKICYSDYVADYNFQ